MLFPILLGCLGLTYTGSEESSSYVLFCGFVALISVGYVLWDLLTKSKGVFYMSDLVFLFSPLAVTLLFLIESPQNMVANRLFIEHFLWGTTAIYVAIYVARTGGLKKFTIPLFVFTLLAFISFVRSIILPFMHGNIFESFAGSSYQEVSYISAFSYSIVFWLILFYKWIFPDSNIGKYIKWLFILLPFYIICIFISGGRGGMVVVFLSTILFLYIKQKTGNKIRFKSLLPIFMLGIISFVVLGDEIVNDERIQLGFDRVFSYISLDGIDMSRTSHRDEVYSEALKLIINKPLVGYGFFSYLDTMKRGYPHNFFLEILLQGGMLFFSVVLFLMGYFCYKLNKMIRYDRDNMLLLPLLVFPFVKLMFSGSYLTEPLFWFGCTYVYSYRQRLCHVN